MRTFTLAVFTPLALAICLGTGAMLAAHSNLSRYSRPGEPFVTSQSEDQSKCCSVALEALEASAAIRPGMTRGEVELHFRPDGGTQVRDVTRYVSRDCQYIMIDVHFKLVPPTDRIGDSPRDLVTELSRPYLAYPRMD